MDKDDFKEEKTNWFNEKMKNSKIFKFTVIIIVLCIVQIGFAGYGIIVKATAQNNNINPLVFSLVRDLACFPLLLICACLVEGFQKPQLKHLPVIFILGLLLFGNQFFFILGLYQTNSPSIASIFQVIFYFFFSQFYC